MRVAVFGGGYAGLPLVRALERTLPEEDDIVLVDASSTHTVRHEVHRVIRRPSIAEDIAIPFEDLLDRADHRQQQVDEIDPEARTATFADGDTLEFDAGAICLGVETEFYDLPGVREHATPLRTIEHAEQIHEQFHETVPADGHVVVGGAGLSGIQVAGEIRALADDRGEGVTVTLLEQAATIAPSFPADIREALRDELDAQGIDVRTNATVERADDATIELAEDDGIEYDQFVWTGGIRSTRAVGTGRPQVPSTLRLTDRVFAFGDAARVVDVDGRGAPATAHTAIRQAPVAAENIRRLLEYDRTGDGGFEPRLKRYDYDQLGWLVSVGDGAVAKVGPQILRGKAAVAVKRSVGAGYLTSVGAVSKAVDLVREEFDLGTKSDDPDSEPEALDVSDEREE